MNLNSVGKLVKIPAANLSFEGILNIPDNSQGIVLFAHGSGSGRLSPRNGFVADALNDANIATLLMDLLTPEEDQVYENRFNIDLLTKRLSSAIKWLKSEELTRNLNIGLFGASTGAAAALDAAAKFPDEVKAVVSRGGRPDLGSSLEDVKCPTLLIVGGNDLAVVELNEIALEKLNSIKKISIIPRATHLFEEPGTLGVVAEKAIEWFKKYL